MEGGLGLLGLVVLGWVGEGCRLLFFLCELSMLCGRYVLCRLLWWWPACSVNVCRVEEAEEPVVEGGFGGRKGL